jgi:hypothetical protein
MNFDEWETSRLSPGFALAASPDGNTLYYSSDRSIWSIAASGGTPQRITEGDSVAVDPNGKELVIKRDDKSGGQLFRVPVSGGAAREIALSRDWALAPMPIGQSAVDRNGRILIPVSPPDSWFYRLAILDPASGQVSTIPLTYTGDTINGNWARNGRVLAVGLPLKSHVWRFSRQEGH